MIAAAQECRPMSPSDERLVQLRRKSSLLRLPRRHRGLKKIRPQNTSLKDHVGSQALSPLSRTRGPQAGLIVEARASQRSVGGSTGWDPLRHNVNRGRAPDLDLLAKHLASTEESGPWGGGTEPAVDSPTTGNFEEDTLEAKLEKAYLVARRTSRDATTPSSKLKRGNRRRGPVALTSGGQAPKTPDNSKTSCSTPTRRRGAGTPSPCKASVVDVTLDTGEVSVVVSLA